LLVLTRLLPVISFATQVPIYDFKESRRSGFRTVEVPHSRVIVIEGIYALSSKLKDHLDLRVSVTGGVHFDLVKRVLRDIDRSGQAPEAIIQQVSDTVYPMYKAFIEPDLATAHIQIYNTFNPFSGFMDATYILKSQKCPTEAQLDELVKVRLKAC
jgi:uridine kinase